MINFNIFMTQKITVSTILWKVEKEKYNWIKIRANAKAKHSLTKSYGNCKRLYFKKTHSIKHAAVLHSTVYRTHL